jgi:hypothetical protein
MQRVQPNSNAAAITPVTITENISCCTRTTKIAIAIFASLAAFVFLPFGIAMTLSAIVTLGAICCNDDDSTPTAAPQSQSSPGVSVGSGGQAAVGSRQIFRRIEPTSTTKIMADILTSDGRFAHMTEAQKEAFIDNFHGQPSPDLDAVRAFCSSSASIASRGLSGDEIPNCLKQDGLSSPSGAGMQDDEDMPDLSAAESSSSTRLAAPLERPKPTNITKGKESVSLFFSTDGDLEAFCTTSSNFIRQYEYKYDIYLPNLELNFKGITDIDTVLDQIKGLYPDELVNIR